MDDAAEMIEDLGEVEQEGASFGHYLDVALRNRMGKGSKPGKPVPEESMEAAEALAFAAPASASAAAAAAAAAAVVEQVVSTIEADETRDNDAEMEGEAAAVPNGTTAVTLQEEQAPASVIEAAAPQAPAGSPAPEAAPVEAAAPSAPPPVIPTPAHLRLLHWHWANLEYGCSARLGDISAAHWNQDEDYGGFGGPHCMVIGGYAQPFEALAGVLDVRTGAAVTEVGWLVFNLSCLALLYCCFSLFCIIFLVPLLAVEGLFHPITHLMGVLLGLIRT
jgi:hypothetical protein